MKRKILTRTEMLEVLQQENENIRLSHRSFSEDEFIIMKGGIIFDENGYNMGGIYDEFMEIRKGGLWEEGWFEVSNETNAFIENTKDDVENLIDHFSFNPYRDLLNNAPFIYEDIPNPMKIKVKPSKLKGKSKSFKGGHLIPHQPSSLIERNDPCPCGSGRKYKKCCLYEGEKAVSE